MANKSQEYHARNGNINIKDALASGKIDEIKNAITAHIGHGKPSVRNNFSYDTQRAGIAGLIEYTLAEDKKLSGGHYSTSNRYTLTGKGGAFEFGEVFGIDQRRGGAGYPYYTDLNGLKEFLETEEDIQVDTSILIHSYEDFRDTPVTVDGEMVYGGKVSEGVAVKAFQDNHTHYSFQIPPITVKAQEFKAWEINEKLKQELVTFVGHNGERAIPNIDSKDAPEEILRIVGERFLIEAMNGLEREGLIGDLSIAEKLSGAANVVLDMVTPSKKIDDTPYLVKSANKAQSEWRAEVDDMETGEKYREIVDGKLIELSQIKAQEGIAALDPATLEERRRLEESVLSFVNNSTYQRALERLSDDERARYNVRVAELVKNNQPLEKEREV